mgnify:CR=1 FL=1|jgi:hypothetical protein|tara:strand:- start:224 stop:667 length:444 start_codon:yes stop_codon:yes gene_type:complete
MSKREDIAGDIITKLDAITSPIEFKKITREPFEPEELADPQFPSCYIQTGDETREILSLGDVGTGKRQGTIDFLIVGFVKGTTSNIDTLRNQLIEVVEETLDADITRNNKALNTQVIEANTDEGVLFPYGGVRIVVRVLYEFVRGTA